MKTVSLKISESLAIKLNAAARSRSRTKSELMREALELYLASTDGHRQASSLERIADLVGCLDGPGDLSSNKKHMEGYGR